jgi:hypothetical protein
VEKPVILIESPALSRNGNAYILQSPNTRLYLARLLPRGKGGRATGKQNPAVQQASRPNKAGFLFIAVQWKFFQRQINELFNSQDQSHYFHPQRLRGANSSVHSNSATPHSTRSSTIY